MIKKSISIVSILSLLFQPLPAFADHWGGHGRRGGYYREVVVHRLPPGYVPLLIGGLTLLFCEGLFYRYTPAGYIVVQPPPGAVVPMLPGGYTTVFVNGMPYYYYGYTYYTPAPGGYMVAAPPAAIPAAPPAVYPSAPAPAPVSAPAAGSSQEKEPDTFEIHIANGDGSFTLVTLKKTDKGFLGPQGEFYPDHPTVDQLKERYNRMPSGLKTQVKK